MFWRPRRQVFFVKLALDGRHPYRADGPHYKSGAMIVDVVARGWDDAERLAFQSIPSGVCWSSRVIAISRVPFDGAEVPA